MVEERKKGRGERRKRNEGIEKRKKKGRKEKRERKKDKKVKSSGSYLNCCSKLDRIQEETRSTLNNYRAKGEIRTQEQFTGMGLVITETHTSSVQSEENQMAKLRSATPGKSTRKTS